MTASYEKSISSKMNDFDLVVFKVMSTIASHSPLNISETVSDRGLFQRTPIGNDLWESRDVTDDVT